MFVSLWNKAAVAVVDTVTDKVIATWPTERHPTEMILAPDGKHLYVACSNSTSVTVLDTAAGKPVQTIRCSLYPAAPSGNTPNSLCLTPDGAALFVANADANNLAVFNVENPLAAKPLGFVPVGWYPTSVRFDAAAKRLIVANGKGLLPRANRHGPQPAGVRGGDHARIHRGVVHRHAERDRRPDAGRDGRPLEGGLRVQPADGRPGPGRGRAGR